MAREDRGPSSGADWMGVGIILLVAGAGALVDAAQTEDARPIVLALWPIYFLLALFFFLFILPRSVFPKRLGIAWLAVVVFMILACSASSSYLDDKKDMGIVFRQLPSPAVTQTPAIAQTPAVIEAPAPSPSPIVTVTPPPREDPIIALHKVREGESFESIAEEYRTAFNATCLSAGDIMGANAWVKRDIYPGDVLVIPRPECERVGPTLPTDLVVQWVDDFEQTANNYLKQPSQSTFDGLADAARGGAQDRMTSILDSFMGDTLRPLDCIGMEVNRFFHTPDGLVSWVIATLTYVPNSSADSRGPRIQRIVFRFRMTFTGAGLAATEVLEEAVGAIRSALTTPYSCK